MPKAPRAPEGAPTGGGRPTKLTPDTEKRIVDLVRGGLSPIKAAIAAGVSRRAVQKWLANGRGQCGRPLARNVRFVRRVREAQARGEADQLVTVQAAARQRTRNGRVTGLAAENARWLLEKMNPKRWGRRTADVNVKATAEATARAAPKRHVFVFEGVALKPEHAANIERDDDDGEEPSGDAGAG